MTPPLSLTLVHCGCWPSGSGFCTPLRVRLASVDAPQLTEVRDCRRDVELVLLLELLGPHEGVAGEDGDDSLLLGTGHCAGSHSPPD